MNRYYVIITSDVTFSEVADDIYLNCKSVDDIDLIDYTTNNND